MYEGTSRPRRPARIATSSGTWIVMVVVGGAHPDLSSSGGGWWGGLTALEWRGGAGTPPRFQLS